MSSAATGSDRYRVFVSSTWIDLKDDERQVVRDRLFELDGFAFVGMERFGARELSPAEVSVSEVEGCQIYLVVVGGRYGSGITDDEYQTAQRKKMPTFCFFKSEAAITETGRGDAEDHAKLDKFKAKLQKAHTSDLRRFSTLAELRDQITKALHNWYVRQHGHSPKEDPARVNELIDRLAALIDKNDQRQHALDAINAADHERRAAPFVVFGPSNEWHEALAQRFAYEGDYQTTGDGRVRVVYNWHSTHQDLERRILAMRIALAKTVSPNAASAAARMTDELLRGSCAASGGTQVFLYELSDRDWVATDTELLRHWLDFWNGVTLKAQSKIIALLAITTPTVPAFFRATLPNMLLRRLTSANVMEKRLGNVPEAHRLPPLRSPRSEDLNSWEIEMQAIATELKVSRTDILDRAKTALGRSRTLPHEALRIKLVKALKDARALGGVSTSTG